MPLEAKLNQIYITLDFFFNSKTQWFYAQFIIKKTFQDSSFFCFVCFFAYIYFQSFLWLIFILIFCLEIILCIMQVRQYFFFKMFTSYPYIPKEWYEWDLMFFHECFNIPLLPLIKLPHWGPFFSLPHNINTIIVLFIVLHFQMYFCLF